jgi:hypothetical protein
VMYEISTVVDRSAKINLCFAHVTSTVLNRNHDCHSEWSTALILCCPLRHWIMSIYREFCDASKTNDVLLSAETWWLGGLTGERRLICRDRSHENTKC